jgi:hypothetical protein
VEGWIFAENLQPFIELLAFLAGYASYDDTYDWIAIENGITDTDAAAGKWYAYTFAGTRPLAFQLAQNVGSNVVSVQVTSDTAIDADQVAQLSLLVLLCQHYNIARRGSGPLR